MGVFDKSIDYSPKVPLSLRAFGFDQRVQRFQWIPLGIVDCVRKEAVFWSQYAYSLAVVIVTVVEWS